MDSRQSRLDRASLSRKELSRFQLLPASVLSSMEGNRRELKIDVTNPVEPTVDGASGSDIAGVANRRRFFGAGARATIATLMGLGAAGLLGSNILSRSAMAPSTNVLTTPAGGQANNQIQAVDTMTVPLSIKRRASTTKDLFSILHETDTSFRFFQVDPQGLASLGPPGAANAATPKVNSNIWRLIGSYYNSGTNFVNADVVHEILDNTKTSGNGLSQLAAYIGGSKLVTLTDVSDMKILTPSSNTTRIWGTMRASNLPEVFNVKGYGAVGDGLTDDSAAIQRAINDVPSAGGTVYFPAGVYRITSTLLPKPYTSMIGEGNNSVLSVPSAIYAIKLGGGEQLCLLDNIKINGGGVGSGIQLGTGTTGSPCHEAHLSRLYFNQCATGILGHTMIRCTVDDSIFVGCGRAMTIEDDGTGGSSNLNQFRSLFITGCGSTDYAVYLKTSSENHFYDRDFSSNYKTTVRLDGGSNMTVFDRCHFEDNALSAVDTYYEIHVNSPSFEAEIRRCNFGSQRALTDIFVNNATSCVVWGNEFSATRALGFHIHLTGSSHILLSNRYLQTRRVLHDERIVIIGDENWTNCVIDCSAQGAKLVAGKKNGVPVDSDYVTPADATMVVDTANNKLWVRINGIWKAATLT